MTVSIATISKPYVQIKENWADAWTDVEYLTALRAEAAVSPGVPAATLAWHYGEILDDYQTSTTLYAPFDLAGKVDYYVRIMRPPDEDHPTPAAVWHGIILGIADDLGGVDAETAAGDQAVACRGLEVLLDRSGIEGSYIEGEEEPVLLSTRLTFNLRHRNGLSLQGNRSLIKYAGPGGMESYVFSEDGEIWSNADIIEYLVAWFSPPALGMEVGGLLSNFTAIEELIECPRNVRDGLNAIIDRRRGHSWSVMVAEGEVPTVWIHSAFSEDVTEQGVTIHAATAKLSLDRGPEGVPCPVIEVNRDTTHEFDRIVVRSQPIILCGTFSCAGETLVPAWGSALETAYKAETATETQDADRLRAAEKYSHVFRAFRVPPEELPGGPASDDDGNLVPATEASHLALGKSICRELPIPKTDADPDGPVDYLTPFAFTEITIGEATQWAILDRLGEWFDGAPSMSLHRLDGEMGVLVGATPNYYLAKGHWDGASPGAHEPVIDYDDLQVTVAWPSDECLKVVVEIEAGECPRTLVIDCPAAECWYMLEGTVTDIDADGPVTSGPTTLRTDVAKLRVVAALAKSWYQRTRQAVTARWPAFIYDFWPGLLLDELTGGVEGDIDCGTQVTKITWDFVAGTTVLQSDFCELDFASLAGAGKKSIGAGSAGSASGFSAQERDRTAAVALRVGSHPTVVVEFPAEITGSTPIDDNRWAYTIVEDQLELAGTYVTKEGGRSGTAYNTFESNNEIDGVQGSGDDVDVFPPGITLQPIGIGAVVRIRVEINCEDDPEYLFTAPNNPGGECV